MARASARVTGVPIELAPAPVVEASWANPYEVHPLDDVSISERADLLVGVTTTIADAGIPLAQAGHQIWDTEKWFVSSEGSRIDQHIVECGAVMDATAIGDGETQRRSYPGVRGQYGTRGWEVVREIDLPGNAPRIAEEAMALLQRAAVPRGDDRR